MQILMIFLGVLSFFYFSLLFFRPSVFCARHLRWRFLFLLGFTSDGIRCRKKRQRISRCLSYVHSAGLYPALTLSFAAELYSAFYSVYAPLIYVRLYFTSCPVMVYTFP